MKTTLLLLPFLPLCTAIALAQNSSEPQPPPPIVAAHSDSALTGPHGENQRVYGPSADTLIARETANGVLENFRKVYTLTNVPRVVIYVNRELVDTGSGFKLTSRREHFEETTATGKDGATSTTKTTGTNDYKMQDSAASTLADKQTVREIERLFGRAFRNAGAQLADQKTAASLLEEKPAGRLVGDQAAKDRAALANIADIAVEVLISSRNLTVPEVSGDQNYSVPDIQATAIRLKDSAIIGQASASDILGKDIQAGRIVRQFDVRDITEATAIALMEDMLTGAK
jgi:hypothetical protein